MEAFKALNIKYLKLIYEELNGAVNCDDLKLLRLYNLTDLPEKHSFNGPNENG